MPYYDSTKEYNNEKEMVMIRFIIPISVSLFNVVNKLEYNVDKDIIEIEVDNLVAVVGEKSKVSKGKPNKHQKNCLVQIKKYYDDWRNFL